MYYIYDINIPLSSTYFFAFGKNDKADKKSERIKKYKERVSIRTPEPTAPPLFVDCDESSKFRIANKYFCNIVLDSLNGILFNDTVNDTSKIIYKHHKISWKVQEWAGRW